MKNAREIPPGGTSREFGGVRAEASRRGPRLLRSCLGVEISIRNSSEANFQEVRLGTPQTSKKSAKRGGFKRGIFPIWTCPSFFVLFCPFWDFPDFSGIFPNCSGMVLGFSRFVLFLFLGLLRAPTRNSPERVRDTIWTFPKKSGKRPGLETPRFSFSQNFKKVPPDAVGVRKLVLALFQIVAIRNCPPPPKTHRMDLQTRAMDRGQISPND